MFSFDIEIRYPTTSGAKIKIIPENIKNPVVTRLYSECIVKCYAVLRLQTTCYNDFAYLIVKVKIA